MATITVLGQKLHLDFKIYTSPSGRPFRHSGVELVTTEPQKWIQGEGYRHATIYWFRYMDTHSEFFGFKMSAEGKYLGKVN